MLMASAGVLLNFLVCVCVCDCCKCVNANTLCLNAESSQQKHKISMHTYVYILVCVFVSKMLVELLLPLLCGSEFFANKQHNFFFVLLRKFPRYARSFCFVAENNADDWCNCKLMCCVCV